MKKKLKISQKRRKRNGIILLIIFLLSSTLVAFPQSKCIGSCSNISVESNCCSVKEDTCCDMMEININNSHPCEMEVNDNSCDYIIDVEDNFTFVVPKTTNSIIELSEIKNVILDTVLEKPQTFSLVRNNIIDSTPPIFITISSFLI